MDLRYVKKLVEMLDESSLDSIEISTEKGMKISVSRAPRSAGPIQVAAPAAMPMVISAMAEPRLTPPAGIAAPAEPAAPPPASAASPLTEVKSPMVGTFYSASGPGAKPYASVGTRVKKGQVLCIIEAMKIMNEIESEFDGVIKEVAAVDAHPVEYGQVLFRIDPNG
ncbi:MAG: acetyl-CoA carboxylase biotin carboxyl carrier protein [Gemmatimonadetes bacterium]|nr:acetyl-CoA carboxylase biotin carboxyl carrier protein [Gemmatimonadota bacterium]